MLWLVGDSFLNCTALESTEHPAFHLTTAPTWAHDGVDMRPTNPPPAVPGDTEAERMKNALRMFLSVPKDAYLKEEARLKRARDRKRAKRS